MRDVRRRDHGYRPDTRAGAPGPDLPEWQAIAGERIANDPPPGHRRRGPGRLYLVVVDRHGNEIVHAGRVANEIVRYPEYSQHPEYGEGPWHLSHRFVERIERSGRPRPVFRSPVGERLRIEGDLEH